MKETIVASLIVFALTISASAKKRPLDPADFPLIVHVTSVDHEQGYAANTEKGTTYTYLVYTVKIEGDPVIYQVRFFPRWVWQYDLGLSIGDYKARWENGALEVLLTYDNGKKKRAEPLKVIGQH
jgi:hypothetical protein